jgi:hypothetical protein
MNEKAYTTVHILNRVMFSLVLITVLIGVVKWDTASVLRADLVDHYARIAALQDQAAEIIQLAAETSVMQKNVTENVEARMIRIEAIQADVAKNTELITQYIVPKE